MARHYILFVVSNQPLYLGAAGPGPLQLQKWRLMNRGSDPRKLDRLKVEFSDTLSWLGVERNRMKASKFTHAQRAFMIKQGEEGMPVAEICRQAGISQATHFNWKKKYATLLPTEIKRLKQMEDENGRLKKIVADLTPDRRRCPDPTLMV